LTRRFRSSLCFGFLLLGSSAAFAQKTDVIVLLNGDRLTGEIKSYSQGRLTLDTSHSGWVNIKWNNILSVQSDKMFDLETSTGCTTTGRSPPPIRPAAHDRLRPQTLTVGFFEVFDLAPVYQKFWSRWDGSLDVGFNYTHSSQLVQFNVSADATYRRRTHQILSSLSSFFSKQEDVTAAERGAFSTIYDRFLGKRWIAEGGFGLDRNIQLGLKMRVSAGLGAGRYLVQANQKELVVFAGFVGNREQPVEGNGKYNTEARVGGRYSYFMYDFPESHRFGLRRSLSQLDGGRPRASRSRGIGQEGDHQRLLSLALDLRQLRQQRPDDGAVEERLGADALDRMEVLTIVRASETPRAGPSCAPDRLGSRRDSRNGGRAAAVR
jgi:hypothetical protein